MPVVIQGSSGSTSQVNNNTSQPKVHAPSKSKTLIIVAALVVLGSALLLFYFKSSKEPDYVGTKIVNPTLKGNAGGFASNGQQLAPGTRPVNNRDGSHTYD